jgi:hypothetical protein
MSAEKEATKKTGSGELAAPTTVGISTTGVPATETPELEVKMRRSDKQPTADQALWVVIRNTTNAISFNNYETFIDEVMCPEVPEGSGRSAPPDARDKVRKMRHRRSFPFPDVEPYRLLKAATEVFLMTKCGVEINEKRLPTDASDAFDEPGESSRFNREVKIADVAALWRELVEGETVKDGATAVTIPYLALIRRRLKEFGLVDPKDAELAEVCQGILLKKLTNPCLLELIWSYWHEEAMLVQTLNAISLRFQNIRSARDRDPLARFDIDPLRGLGNLLWGYIQDEQHRLSVVRRAYEYDHHYGLTLQGKAIPALRPADSRSKFLEAFHNLLYLCAIFYKEDDDTTVIADGFPVLNALKEVHLVLAEGAHNQFGDLPSTARQEMLMQQWLLARPEMREFLGGRIMVPYPENWMDRVDTMKALQAWTDVTVIHFRDLGLYGEQVLLSIRFGAWSTDPAPTPDQAANWARYWRPEIQAYIHAYRAVTGVDLTAEATDVQQAAARILQPSVHLQNRLALQSRDRPRGQLPSSGALVRDRIRR